jgi:arylsulfatase A-like enzyme
MLVTPRWKIAVNKRGQTYLLFDLENDPHETRNLAGNPEHEADDRRLRDRLLRRIVQTARDPDQESDD